MNLSEEMGEARKDLKKIADKVDLKFGKMEDILADLKKDADEMKIILKQMQRSPNLEHEDTYKDQQTASGDAQEEDLSGDELKQDGQEKKGRETIKIKTKKMAVKKGGGKENIQTYFFKNRNEMIQRDFNMQKDKNYKIETKKEEMGIKREWRLDQRKRMRNETEGEDEGGAAKRGGLYEEKKEG